MRSLKQFVERQLVKKHVDFLVQEDLSLWRRHVFEIFEQSEVRHLEDLMSVLVVDRELLCRTFLLILSRLETSLVDYVLKFLLVVFILRCRNGVYLFHAYVSLFELVDFI